MTAKSRSIKDAKHRFGGCAWKALKLTSGDLRSCPEFGTEGSEPQNEFETGPIARWAEQSAEVSRMGCRSVPFVRFSIVPKIFSFLGKIFEAQAFIGMSQSKQPTYNPLSRNLTMKTMSVFTVRQVAQIDATVVTPVSKTYGSLEINKLQELGDGLANFAACSKTSQVILDLTGIKAHGSTFLNLLIAFAGDLRRQGAELIVCGDQTGLVAKIGMSEWCENHADLCTALETCALKPLLH